MSGITIHSEDPISSEASGVSPQTAYNSNVRNLSQPAEITASSPYESPPAQPGSSAPTPTSSDGPPDSQPGQTPLPLPPTITAKPSLPPPPKVGEKPLSPERYAPFHSTSQPQPYPSQMLQPPVDRPFNGVPPGSTTSTSMTPSFNPSAQPNDVSSPTDQPVRASLEHPPGYMQNPFASDMTPDQRLTAEQQQENQSNTLPSLGYIDDSKGPRLGLEDDETVWGTTKKWAKETGEQAGKLWEKFSPEN